MRLLGPLIAIALAGAVAYLVYTAGVSSARGRTVRLRAQARWQTRHYAERGETVVAVSLMLPTGEVLDEHVVARVSDADPDWNAHFLRAREEAAERAFHLNAAEEPPPG
jgi:hypothetical protein